jgi:pyruvate/2-oxoglutarate dehydrogenase complex dihydrolipoamide dehydrogenase (E3) component
LLCRSRLLPSEEPEISIALENYLKDEGVNVVSGIDYKAVSHKKALLKKSQIILEYHQDGQSFNINAEHLMIATGRRANSKDLGLEAMNIDLLPNGGIKVNDYMQTSHDTVYAAGDVTGRDQFVYMAAYGAKIAAQNAMESNKSTYNNKTMPSVVFTDPQVASVGLTEERARKEGFDVQTSVLPLEYVPRALAARDTRGLIKLVADKKTDKLLGAHILAPEGADTIQTAALAISQDMTVETLGSMIFPYLTTVEGLKLAAQTFNKDVSKLSCCAG